MGLIKIIKKSFFYSFIISVILFIISVSLAYILIKNCEAYKMAENYIKNSKFILEKMGKIEKIDLALQKIESYSNSGLSGEADITLSIKSNNNKGYANFVMKKELGVWEILKVKFIDRDGKSYIIEKEKK